MQFDNKEEQFKPNYYIDSILINDAEPGSLVSLVEEFSLAKKTQGFMKSYKRRKVGYVGWDGWV